MQFRFGVDQAMGARLSSSHLRYDGKPQEFREDPAGAQELKNKFGGEWKAYILTQAIVPSGHPSLEFGVETESIQDLPGPGEFMPEANTLRMAVSLTAKGTWIDFTRTQKVRYPDVIVSFISSNENYGSNPWQIAIDKGIYLDAVALKNTTTSQHTVVLQGEILRDGQTIKNWMLRRLLLVQLDRKLVQKILVPTGGLLPGVYALRMTARGEDVNGPVLGEKIVAFEVRQ